MVLWWHHSDFLTPEFLLILQCQYLAPLVLGLLVLLFLQCLCSWPWLFVSGSWFLGWNICLFLSTDFSHSLSWKSIQKRSWLSALARKFCCHSVTYQKNSLGPDASCGAQNHHLPVPSPSPSLLKSFDSIPLLQYLSHWMKLSVLYEYSHLSHHCSKWKLPDSNQDLQGETLFMPLFQLGS